MHKKRQKLFSSFLVGALLANLIFSGAVQAIDEKLEPEVTVSLDDRIAANETLSAVWMGYAMARVAWIRNQFRTGKLNPAIYENSFSEELAGRRTLAYIWHEIQKNQKAADAYLDQLAKVQAAGFLPEYVWHYLNSAEWHDRPANLRLDAFTVWNQSNLPEHRPETLAEIRVVKPT